MNTLFETPTTLLPAVVQDAQSGQVLMVAYMNREAYDLTLKTQKVTFWSRSREELWTKGATSGNFLNYVEHAWDCDQDTLLIQVNPEGPSCHTGSFSCFGKERGRGFLGKLDELVQQRMESDDATSYVNRLTASGGSRVAQKIGEEGVELALAVVKKDREEIINECADLFFHALVGLRASGLTLADVEDELLRRNQERTQERTTASQP